MTTTHNDEEAVRQLHDEVISSFNARDLGKLLSLHADNIILMEPGMPAISGKAELMRRIRKFQQKPVYELSCTICELEVFGKRAFVRGQVVKQISQNSKAPLQGTAKFTTLSQKQEDGRWKMVAGAFDRKTMVSAGKPHDLRITPGITKFAIKDF